MYSNSPSPTHNHEDIQSLDRKEPELVIHQSPDRFPTFVTDVLSEKEELVEIEESGPHSGDLTSPDDRAGVSSASTPSDHVVLFHKLVGQMSRTLEIPLISIKESSYSVFDSLGAASKQRVTLPLLEGLSQPAKTIWNAPHQLSLCQKKLINCTSVLRKVLLYFILTFLLIGW